MFILVSGRDYTHVKSSEVYRVLMFCQVKTENGWKEGVVYYRVNGRPEDWFVRSVESFHLSFRPI